MERIHPQGLKSQHRKRLSHSDSIESIDLRLKEISGSGFYFCNTYSLTVMSDEDYCTHLFDPNLVRRIFVSEILFGMYSTSENLAL